MDLGADDLVLKLIVLKCGWAGREAWQSAVAKRQQLKGRNTLVEILRDDQALTPEQVRLVVDPSRRRDYLKQLVEDEKRFWEHPPGTIGGLPVEGPVAKGGRALIFRGQRQHRPVAVKVLAQAYAFDLEEVERFHRQRDFGLMLDHPNLIKVYDSGCEGAVPYLVMDWVEGQPLARHLEENRAFQLEPLVDHFIQASRGMAHAHDRGVLHKDLKPDNILVDRVGHVVVSDFGVAQRFGEAGEEGVVVGTPAYMSPEQARGATADLDARADIFSMGATLYECLTRRQPFAGEKRRDVLAAAAAWRFDPPRKLNPDVPPELEAIVLRAMAKRPGDRYPSMQALGQNLTLWLEGKTVPAKRSWLGRVLGRQK